MTATPLNAAISRRDTHINIMEDNAAAARIASCAPNAGHGAPAPQAGQRLGLREAAFRVAVLLEKLVEGRGTGGVKGRAQQGRTWRRPTYWPSTARKRRFMTPTHSLLRRIIASTPPCRGAAVPPCTGSHLQPCTPAPTHRLRVQSGASARPRAAAARTITPAMVALSHIGHTGTPCPAPAQRACRGASWYRRPPWRW